MPLSASIAVQLNCRAGISSEPTDLEEHDRDAEKEGSEEEDDCSSLQVESEEDEWEFRCEARRAAGTPAQLRTKIRKLLKETDIKVGEFQKMIGVTSPCYTKFMDSKYKSPWRAAQNETYGAAAVFFAREKKLGPRAVGKLRKVTGTKGSDGAAKPVLPDVTDVSTDGKTYLTPGETRREIQELTKKFKCSAAELARIADISAQMVSKFINAGGPWGGKDMLVYRPLANLMEKFRIATNKAKSKKRKALEAEMAEGRMQRNGQPFLGVDPNAKFLCLGNERPILARDELGRKVVKFQRCS